MVAIWTSDMSANIHKNSDNDKSSKRLETVIVSVPKESKSSDNSKDCDKMSLKTLLQGDTQETQPNFDSIAENNESLSGEIGLKMPQDPDETVTHELTYGKY